MRFGLAFPVPRFRAFDILFYGAASSSPPLLFPTLRRISTMIRASFW